MSRTSRSFRDGTTDRYFRYMMLDEVNSALYVGAMWVILFELIELYASVK